MPEYDSEPREVASDVWRVTTPLPFPPRAVHAYLVRLARGRYLLVDGGVNTDGAWAALDGALRALGVSWRGVALHVVTHMHLDHVGLSARARASSGATLAMGALDAERRAHAAAHPAAEAAYRMAMLRRCGAPAAWIEEVEAARVEAAGLDTFVPADVALAGAGGALPDAPGWRWLWTPGHTAGHVALSRAEDGVLIAGDAVLPRITPTIGVNPQRADPVRDYLAGLDEVERLAPARILPGHGDVLADAARVAELRDACLASSRAWAGLLAPEPQTAWALVARRYASRELNGSARVLALRECLAHLDRLVAAGAAVAADAADGHRTFARADGPVSTSSHSR